MKPERKNFAWTNRFIYISTPIPHSIYGNRAIVFITFVFNFRVFFLKAMELMALLNHQLSGAQRISIRQIKNLSEFLFLINSMPDSLKWMCRHQSLFKESSRTWRAGDTLQATSSSSSLLIDSCGNRTNADNNIIASHAEMQIASAMLPHIKRISPRKISTRWI